MDTKTSKILGIVLTGIAVIAMPIVYSVLFPPNSVISEKSIIAPAEFTAGTAPTTQNGTRGLAFYYDDTTNKFTAGENFLAGAPTTNNGERVLLYCWNDTAKKWTACEESSSSTSYPDQLSQIGNVSTTTLSTNDILYYTGSGWAVTATSSWDTDTNTTPSDSTWTIHDSYPAACAAGQYVSTIGDILTCAVPTNTTYSAGNGLQNIGNTFSIDTTYANTFSALQTFGSASTTYLSATTLYGNLIGDVTGDLTCTNCINATEIEDIYVLTAGDEITGTLDVAGTSTLVGNVGLDGCTAPNFDLCFGAALGQKIGLYQNLHTGIGLQVNLMEFIGYSTDLDWTFGSDTSGALTRVMTIEGTGNVGIATTVPVYKLDVNGTVRSTGALTIGAYTLPATDGTANYVLKTDGSGTVTWQSDSEGSGSGGSSIWSTSTNLYYHDGTDAFLIGGSATTSDVIFEIIGTSEFDAATFSGTITGDVTGDLTGTSTYISAGDKGDITVSGAGWTLDDTFLVSANIDTLAELNAMMGETIASTTNIWDFSDYTNATADTGIKFTSDAIGFDCSEVEGTGINCATEAITLDATGNWTGTLDSIEGADFLTEAEFYATTTDGLAEGSTNLYQDGELTAWIDDVTLGSAGALTIPTGQDLIIGTITWTTTDDKIDGEQIYDDTIDNDSIDWGDMTDLTTDGALDADVVDETHIADNGIDSEHYNDGSIDAIHLADDTVTHAKMLDSDQTDTKCIWFEDPTADDDFKSIWANKTANDLLITEIWGESDQTVSFDLQIDDNDTEADVSGTDIAPAAGEAEDTSLEGDTTLAAGEELDLIITSVTNTPTWVSICWTYNWVD